MQEDFEKTQTEQRRQIEALTKKLDELTAQQTAAANSSSSNAVTPDQVKELNDKVEGVVEAQKKTLMSEFNPAIGFVGETIFSYRSKGSEATGSDRPGGFDVWQRSLEMIASASVDPFAKGYTVINASADAATGEASLGVEEAALQTTSLPWNLEVKAGRFFGEFGRLSYIHDHELPFVNRPLVLDQYIGGESRSDGLQVNWLVPTEHYISLTAGLGDSFGGDSPNPDDPGNYRAFDGLNFWGRLSTYFDLTPNWQLESGVSGLWNPTEKDRGGVILQPDGSGFAERERRLAGLDVKLSYVPLQDNQFRSFTWGTEMLYSDNRYLVDPAGTFDPNSPPPGLSTETVGSLGLYSYMTYKWSRQWSAGFLFDYVQSTQNHSDVTTGLFAVHHVRVEPLEPTAIAIHAHQPQRRVRLEARRRRLSAMGMDHRRALARLATTLN